MSRLWRLETETAKGADEKACVDSPRAALNLSVLPRRMVGAGAAAAGAGWEAPSGAILWLIEVAIGTHTLDRPLKSTPRFARINKISRCPHREAETLSTG